jgi:hypothetical protein
VYHAVVSLALILVTIWVMRRQTRVRAGSRKVKQIELGKCMKIPRDEPFSLGEINSRTITNTQYLVLQRAESEMLART